ncbi:MAG TPA: aminopeptidase P family protein [Microthrixaceae bacterium]|nr:aminopeptidase P family protein [Microthrixaceae bacterium]
MAVTENVVPDYTPDALPPMDVAARILKLRQLFDKVEIDAILVTNLVNIRYLCGFTGSAGLLLVTPDETVFVSDGRYKDQSAAEITTAGVDARIEITGADPDAAIADAAHSAGIARLGLEEQSVTWALQRRWESDLFTLGELVPTGGMVEELRLVKDAAESARIRSACAIADRALMDVRSRLADGPTEVEFGLELDARMRQLGAADVSFETIVASGPNGAKPHHHPSRRQIVEGDLVVIDFGALVDGYHSDMTRTLAVGDIGPDRQRMFDVVIEAQQAGVDAVRQGVKASDVDTACREVIDEAGWGDAFLHGTGHGVGLDIHEEPRVSSRSAATLVAGHVVTVEPGVYLPDLGGVRIEDTLLVTEDGSDRLTRATKDPSIVPSIG